MQCDYYFFLNTFPTEFCNENLTAMVKMSSFLYVFKCMLKNDNNYVDIAEYGRGWRGCCPPAVPRAGLQHTADQRYACINPNLTGGGA